MITAIYDNNNELHIQKLLQDPTFLISTAFPRIVLKVVQTNTEVL